MTVLLPRDPGSPSVVGLVPGSFDPPTVAHAALARGLEDLGCELVLYVWSVHTLPKETAAGGEPTPPLLEDDERLACLEAVVGEGPGRGLALASHGLLAQQAEAAAQVFPAARLILGVGSDKVLQLLDPRWYEDRAAALDHLTGLASIAYAHRSGDDEVLVRALSEPSNARWRSAFVELALEPGIASISSRWVRSELRSGRDPSEALPRGVAAVLGEAGVIGGA
jgi:nicotinamide-nucleotide adenylyltransferase